MKRKDMMHQLEESGCILIRHGAELEIV